MKNLYVKCENTQQRKVVHDELEARGCGFIESSELDLTIGIYECGSFQYLNHNCKFNPETTYSQFMEKYSVLTLNQIINQAKQALNISESALSIRIGYSRKYLTQMKRVGCSTKKQDEIISLINSVLSGEVIKNDKEVIAELSEKLTGAQDTAQHNANCAHRYLDMVHDREKQIKSLENANTDLNSELNSLRETLQELDTTNKSKSATIASQIQEIAELRESMSNQQQLNIDLNEECSRLESMYGERDNAVASLVEVNASHISKLNSLRTKQKIYWTMIVTLMILCVLGVVA